MDKCDRRSFVKAAVVSVPLGVAGGYCLRRSLFEKPLSQLREQKWRDAELKLPVSRVDKILEVCMAAGATYAVGGTAANIAAGNVPHCLELIVEADRENVLARLEKCANQPIPLLWHNPADIRLNCGDVMVAIECNRLNLHEYQIACAREAEQLPFRHMALVFDVQQSKLRDSGDYYGRSTVHELALFPKTRRDIANMMSGFREAARHNFTLGAEFNSFLAIAVEQYSNQPSLVVAELINGLPELITVLGPEKLPSLVASPLICQALSTEVGFKLPAFNRRLRDLVDRGNDLSASTVLACMIADADAAAYPHPVDRCFLTSMRIPRYLGMVREALGAVKNKLVA